MAGQGSVINAVARALSAAEWVVVFTCTPNTAHHNVVPIPTVSGGAKQRYPDILAVRQGITRLVEVELTLNERVLQEIIERFEDDLAAFAETIAWNRWRDHVGASTGIKLPAAFVPDFQLVICRGLSARDQDLIRRLAESGIRTISALDYSP